MKNVTSGGSTSIGQSGDNHSSGQDRSTGHQQGRSSGMGGATSLNASGGKDHLATKWRSIKNLNDELSFFFSYFPALIYPCT